MLVESESTENGATRIDGFGYAVVDIGTTEYQSSLARYDVSVRYSRARRDQNLYELLVPIPSAGRFTSMAVDNVVMRTASCLHHWQLGSYVKTD